MLYSPRVINKMRILALLALCFAAVPAIPSNPQRIVGGSVATISQYPTIAAVLRLNLGLYSQVCGGTILNSRSILTAAYCTINEIYGNTRIRVGSTWANSGGVVHNVNGHIVHPSYDVRFLDYDIAILRSATTIYFDNNVRVASIAGPNYNLTDDQAVWAAGWGVTYVGDSGSEHLRHVELMAVNQTICRNNYAQLTRISITDNMLCAGWPSGGRDQCSGDAGGPLYHNDVVVGVYSFGGCNWDLLFSVNARVSRFASWIQSNA